MQTSINVLKSKYQGCFLGLAVGDALGTTLEFQTSPKILHKDIVGGGPFHLLPGQWTDDTSLFLCLSMSLIEERGFNPKDQLKRYLKWYKYGHMSSNGICFDIGTTTQTALHYFEQTNSEYFKLDNIKKAGNGNGSLMRLCPVPLLYRKNPQLAIELVHKQLI
jgi:ADP-ribosyl-[dinitrogen reductase] hydrolase